MAPLCIDPAGMPPHSDHRLSVSVIIVAYRSADRLAHCLAALDAARAAHPATEVIVVNNSDEDGAEIAALCAAHAARFVAAGRNLGYGPGCNRGAAEAVGEFLLFLNPDVTVPPDAIAALAALGAAHPDIVALGPLQRAGDGAVKGKRRAAGDGRGAWGAPLRSVGARDDLVPTGFISGGALMVRRDAFRRVGGFDARVFLFHEDDDLCLRLRPLGRLAYAVGVVVGHDWGTSSPRGDAMVRFRAFHLGRSKLQVMRKHYGRRGVVRPILDSLLKLLSPAMLTRRGRLKAAGFAAGVIAALNDKESPR